MVTLTARWLSTLFPLLALCTGVREQFSTVTHWLDASMVYGNTDEQDLAIRNFYKGQLAFRDIYTGIPNDQYTDIFQMILPSLPSHGPTSCKALDPRRTCFLAGDDRVNQQPPLMALHTVFMRYHNHIANFMAAVYLTGRTRFSSRKLERSLWPRTKQSSTKSSCRSFLARRSPAINATPSNWNMKDTSKATMRRTTHMSSTSSPRRLSGCTVWSPTSYQGELKYLT